MNDMISCPVTASIINSVMGSGKSSFGHATLRSRKSTHTRIWPFFLRTGTMLDIQVGYFTSRINPASISLLTSPSIEGMSSGRKRR
nr:hypothetical protein RchiOBHm_Chr6g0263221 [Ipomoea trifida]GMC57760.1 zinc finger BED domain-containing protein RICESLEEPER 2-like [Ipomoea batatas]GMC68224.1 zinc finger BED domain-containing protein RICESLEEPER 2-like [Ipomoea batatas]GMD68309.1 zinc finger BED domain-containing protein RICESLEEPER 2-like [Ipomoea batatas]